VTTLLVQVGDQTVPLKDCGWIVSALVAVSGGNAYVTEEQAHKQLEPRKRDRDKDIREGLTFELITMAAYRADIGSRWECDQHRPAATGPDQVHGQLAIEVPGGAA
jgi:hypothetical protein